MLDMVGTPDASRRLSSTWCVTGAIKPEQRWSRSRTTWRLFAVRGPH